MPEELPAEPSIKPLLNEKRRRHKKLLPAPQDQESAPSQAELWNQ